MKKFSLLILPILVIVLASCNKGPLKGYKKITPVFGYKLLSDMDTGTQAGKGLYMLAYAQVTTMKDSAVANTNLGSGFNMQIPIRKTMPGSDLMKGFQKLSD